MYENAARACWQGRYQNCDVWYCAPSVFSAGAAGASCSGWPVDCKPEYVKQKTRRSGFRLDHYATLRSGATTNRNRERVPLPRISHNSIDTNGITKNNFARFSAFLTDFHCHNKQVPAYLYPHTGCDLLGEPLNLHLSNPSVAVGFSICTGKLSDFPS